MAYIKELPPPESLEPEQPPIEPAVRALKFIFKLEPKSSDEVRSFFEEYEITRVMAAVVETFGEIRPKFDENRPRFGETRPRPAGNTVFTGKGWDSQFQTTILPAQLYEDDTSRPAGVHAWVESHSPEMNEGNPTIRAVTIYEDGSLVGTETIKGPYGRTIKEEDKEENLDELRSFAKLQYLCGAMIEHFLILKDKQEQADAEQAALAA